MTRKGPIRRNPRTNVRPKGVSPPVRASATPGVAGVPSGRGIYRITCTALGKVYIGQAANFTSRWLEHQSDLLAGLHTNSGLQAAFNHYGPRAFTFEVLEYVSSTEKDALSLAEHRHMTQHRGQMFNVRPAGDDNFIARMKLLGPGERGS